MTEAKPLYLTGTPQSFACRFCGAEGQLIYHQYAFHRTPITVNTEGITVEPAHLKDTDVASILCAACLNPINRGPLYDAIMRAMRD